MDIDHISDFPDNYLHFLKQSFGSLNTQSLLRPLTSQVVFRSSARLDFAQPGSSGLRGLGLRDLIFSFFIDAAGALQHAREQKPRFGDFRKSNLYHSTRNHLARERSPYAVIS